MNHTANSVTLVCYDITSNKLRRKIDRCMKDFGIRLQFSIFICRLNAGDMMRCREKLKKVLVRYGSERKPNDSLIIFEHIQSEAVDCLLGTQIENIPPMFKIF